MVKKKIENFYEKLFLIIVYDIGEVWLIRPVLHLFFYILEPFIKILWSGDCLFYGEVDYIPLLFYFFCKFYPKFYGTGK